MSICEYCHGAGKIKTIKLISAEQGFDCVEEVCTMCNGSGVHEQINEEWIRTCKTEEMEHTLTMLIMKDRFFADKEFAYVNIRFGVHCWLKEKHSNE